MAKYKDTALKPYTVVYQIDGEYQCSGWHCHVTAASPSLAIDAAKEHAVEELTGMVPDRGGGVLHRGEIESGFQEIVVFRGHQEAAW